MPNFEHLIDPGPVPNPDPAPHPGPVPNPDPASGVNPDLIYTENEQHDVNAITVCIPDQTTPIVVLFGPPSSGKTITLLRMIKYLEENHYQVEPETVFRPASDTHYARMCVELREQAYSNYAPSPTDVISFMLVKVLYQGHPVCQILEAPGEHYFNGKAETDFPTYINGICASNNRKIWVFFVEQDWGANQNERDLYAKKICGMQSNVSQKDKVVFLYNKVDKRKAQYNDAGRPILSSFFQNISNQYPGIFDRYSNKNWLMKLLYGKYNFESVCFSSGTFNRTADGRQVWTRGKDFYCEDLWKIISR